MWLAALALAGVASADEGMWTPEQLPAMAERLAGMGLELPAEQLADPMGQPLGSIVALGFCSASFISPDGLVITNHHCATGFLQTVSDAEHNRAVDGFIARSRAEELWAGPAARLYVVESITDVTGDVLKKVRKRTRDADRVELIERAEKDLVAACEARPGRRCEVVSFYEGLSYRLISRLEFKDVRLVYAPPDSVGNYGDEVDNWMWPRHAGDFAMLRPYVAPDGSLAEHAPENVPYKPPHHLSIDPDGVSPGDFVMVAGYPGGTYRYKPGPALAFHRDHVYPESVALGEAVLEVLRAEAALSDEARGKLLSPIGMIANSVKYSEGMLDGFAGSDLVEAKQAEWDALKAWVDADKARRKAWGPALTEMETLMAADQATWERDHLVGWLVRGADLLSAAHRAYRWSVESSKPDAERDSGYQERDRARTRARIEQIEEGLWLPADRRIAALLLERILALPPELAVPPVAAWVEAQGGLQPALDRLYTEPALADTPTRLALLEKSRAELEASTDPWVELAVALEGWLAVKREADKAHDGAVLRVRPLVMQAMVEQRGGALYPDANNTLRVTVGHVKGWRPRDGVEYLPQTTVAGVVEKAGDWPFDAPERLLAAAPAAPASRWADPALGDVPVDFLTTLDTTGGNSGSATLNGRGELVGVIFDGNYESMSADWLFNPEVTRSIHVDIRYILWMLDEVEHADNILTELGVTAADPG